MAVCKDVEGQKNKDGGTNQLQDGGPGALQQLVSHGLRALKLYPVTHKHVNKLRTAVRYQNTWMPALRTNCRADIR